jgi:hypothetical protein
MFVVAEPAMVFSSRGACNLLLALCSDAFLNVSTLAYSCTRFHSCWAACMCRVGGALSLCAVRVATVRVVEAVERWRTAEQVRAQAKAKAKAAAAAAAGAASGRTFTVRLLVTGPEVYKASKAFSSVTGQLKRLQRSEQVRVACCHACGPRQLQSVGAAAHA